MVYWDEGVVWLWCEWEKDWRRGCGKIRGDNSRCVKGRKVVLVELAPVAKACEVGREMD